MVRDVVSPLLNQDPAELAAELAIGPPKHCIDLLRAYADAGAQQILLWPVRDPLGQLHRFDALVRPHVRA